MCYLFVILVVLVCSCRKDDTLTNRESFVRMQDANLAQKNGTDTVIIPIQKSLYTQID